MKKKIIKVGGESLGIRFSKNECELYNLEEGTIVDLSDMIIVKEKEE